MTFVVSILLVAVILVLAVRSYRAMVAQVASRAEEEARLDALDAANPDFEIPQGPDTLDEVWPARSWPSASEELPQDFDGHIDTGLADFFEAHGIEAWTATLEDPETTIWNVDLPSRFYAIGAQLDLDSYVALIRHIQALHPSAHILGTCDWLNEHLVISQRTVEAFELESPRADWPVSLQDRVLPDGTTLPVEARQRLDRRVHALRSGRARYEWDKLAHTLHWVERNPELPGSTIGPIANGSVDDIMLVCLTNLASGADRLAAMPVHSARHHYDPFEVSLIVERFEARHALRLFAVGHGYLGFLKAAAWSPAAIAPLVEDIQFLLAHSLDPPDVPPATAITDWLTAHDYIFLACTPTVPHR